jgi:hypothetical protein
MNVRRMPERFRRSFRATAGTELEVLTLNAPMGRRTCCFCGRRRQGAMLVEIGDRDFAACGACTEALFSPAAIAATEARFATARALSGPA